MTLGGVKKAKGSQVDGVCVFNCTLARFTVFNFTLNLAICLWAALSPIIMIVVVIIIILIIINNICSVMCFAFLLPANANVSVFVLTTAL